VNEQEVFVLADRALASVVDQIRDDQWDMTLPPDFPVAREDEGVTLRRVISYHAYDEAWVPDTLAGRTMDEVGKDKFDGDLLGDDPKASFAALVDKACAAVRSLDDPERTTHLSYGDFPAREYLTHITSFRGLRAHDIAKAIGADTTLPADLVQGLWDQLEPHAEEWRAIGVFGPRVDVPDDAPLQDRLLGLTGREPDSAR
jgi:uncharacterized protein (TIGR03086 family)